MTEGGMPQAGLGAQVPDGIMTKEQRVLLESCTLCPRRCRINRLAGERGYCGMTAEVMGARAALHMWEEPCISGVRGSGAVFFSGCSLGCVFCQNRPIAAGEVAKPVPLLRLTEIFLELQEQGAANINLVTAGHFAPQTAWALAEAKRRGLRIPVVYNSSGYESKEALETLGDQVDVWLPDFKYMDPGLAKKYSHAEDYPRTACQAVDWMVHRAGLCEFDQEGYVQKGVIVRHLILPGHTKDSMAVLKYLHERYGDSIYISIMNQYTPLPQVEAYPELARRVTKREYEKVLDYALELGISNGFFQEGETARESFIPLFDYEGL